jgi:hypothetical protein
MASYQGGCLCGQVRFSLNAEPVASRVCWCRDCQRLAANGTANAIFPTGHDGGAPRHTGRPLGHSAHGQHLGRECTGVGLSRHRIGAQRQTASATRPNHTPMKHPR